MIASDRMRLSNGSLLGILMMAGLSLYLCRYPLWHTDVWAHAKYGEWYVAHRTSPGVEPLSPFSDKAQTFPDVAWLSQVAYHGLYVLGASIRGGDAESRLAGGAEAIRSFHLLLLLARMGLLWLTLRRFGGSPTWATLGVLLYFLAVGIGSAVQRPQAFGLFFFTAILYAISTPTLSRRAMYWLPLCFVFWANLHGTFMAGLALLGLHGVGQLVTRGCRDREIARLLLLGACCGLATLLNPHGIHLYRDLFAFSAHPNLQSMTEWFPMRFTAGGGNHWPYLMSLVLIALVGVLGRRPLSLAACIIAVPFALWPWWQGRMILWWWTIAVWLLARLGPRLADRFPTLPALPDTPPSRRNAWIALVAVGIAIVAFPAWPTYLLNQPVERVVAKQMPWRVALELQAMPEDHSRWQPELRAALREQYPNQTLQGAIFASETQGDFLVWALPPREWPVLMFTHAHVFSVEHWEACRNVKAGNPGWNDFLDRYGANLIVVEIDSHAELVREVEKDSRWLIVSRAEGVVVALRKSSRD